MSSQADVLAPQAKAARAHGSTNTAGFTDYFDLDGLLTEEHKLIRQTMRDFVLREINPSIEQWAQQAHFPSAIVRKFGEVGAFGPTIPTEYGGGGLDYISYGLIMQEIERGDSGMRSTASVQGSLVMFPIYAYGSEAQRRKFLPKLASGEWLGGGGGGGGLLRPHRARPRLEPRRHDDPAGGPRRLLSAEWRQALDFQLARVPGGCGVG